MAQNPQQAIPAGLQASVDSLKTSAANAATKIQELRNRIDTGMSDADVAQLQGELDAVATGLNAAAADPTQPPQQFPRKK